MSRLPPLLLVWLVVPLAAVPAAKSAHAQHDTILREIQRVEKRTGKTYQRAIRDLTKLQSARSVLLRQVKHARLAAQARARRSTAGPAAERPRQTRGSARPPSSRRSSAKQRTGRRQATPRRPVTPRQPTSRQPTSRRATSRRANDPILGRIAVMRGRTSATYRSLLTQVRTLRSTVLAQRSVALRAKARSKAEAKARAKADVKARAKAGAQKRPPSSPVRSKRARARVHDVDVIKQRLASLQRSAALFKKGTERERRALARTASLSARVLRAERSRLERVGREATNARAQRGRPPVSAGRRGGIDPSRRTELARKMKRDAERLRRIKKELRALERQVSKLERDLKRLRTPAKKRARQRGDGSPGPSRAKGALPKQASQKRAPPNKKRSALSVGPAQPRVPVTASGRS